MPMIAILCELTSKEAVIELLGISTKKRSAQLANNLTLTNPKVNTGTLNVKCFKRIIPSI
jgi:hypothetical protein